MRIDLRKIKILLNIVDRSCFTNVEADNYKRVYLTNKKYSFA